MSKEKQIDTPTNTPTQQIEEMASEIEIFGEILAALTLTRRLKLYIKKAIASRARLSGK